MNKKDNTFANNIKIKSLGNREHTKNANGGSYMSGDFSLFII